MDAIPDYIKRKHNPDLITYDVPELQPFLEETYGIIVYQEQVQRVVQEFAGFSLGAGYLLIKAVAKKIPSLLKEQREKFIRGARERGHKQETAEKIFALIEPFSGYGFNKSHSTGYAFIAYQTAYLKARFPTEFMAALLSSDAQRTDRIMIEIEECKAMGIAVLPPDINESLKDFTPIPAEQEQKKAEATKSAKAGSIRFGLAAIKGIGESSVGQIIAVREAGGPFTSIEDFARRMPSKLLNKKTVEALAKSGALDSLADRRVLLEHYEKVVDFCKASGDAGSAQADLFGQMEGGIATATIEFPKTPKATILEKLKWEKETLGMYVSSHPLAGLRKYIGKKAQLIGNLTAKEAGKTITLAGIEEGLKRIMTKKGETMAVLTLEDPTGKMEVTLFPRVFSDAQKHLEQPDTVLVIGGTLDVRGGQLQLRASALKRASLSTMITRAKEEGFFDEEEAKRGIIRTRPDETQEETVELVDEEGNVIAGETMTLGGKNEGGEEFLGPLGKWIVEGMKVEEALKMISLEDGRSPLPEHAPLPDERPELATSRPVTGNDATRISVHTVVLPPRAPRQLLLDLKKTFETFPGAERIQLKIGEQIIPVPLTVTMSTVLEQRIEDVMARYGREAKR
ncbi:hypothetical protein HY213_03655, partial [Candidatus Peregrinibacteria bacterium]|nr:hypothetical protein [Candidatus Peregrinibacteria bacterium]